MKTNVFKIYAIVMLLSFVLAAVGKQHLQQLKHQLAKNPFHYDLDMEQPAYRVARIKS
jgi:hypothetical protein